MTATIYELSVSIGYHHPLHPTLTHVPIGLVIGGFVFGVAGKFIRRPSLVQTARHCMGLALIAAFPTILLGLMDWQHFYGGSWLFPITMKLIFAGTLLVLLAAVVFMKKDTFNVKLLALYAACFLNVVALGFFGGELVYGTRAPERAGQDERVQKGADLFAQSCSMCHFTDKKETKVGPGLKGLFDRESLPVSGRPVTAEAIRSQLRSPYENMPAFKDLSKDQVAALIAYLKTL